MPHYKKLYLKLFNEITDIIDRLQQVQRDAEEMYVSDGPADLCEHEKTEV